MDKEKMVLEYLDLAVRYSAMIGTSEEIDESEKQMIADRINIIREELGMDKIKLI